MLASAIVAAVAVGGAATMVDIEKRTAIRESFIDRMYNEDIEDHILLQWYITGFGVALYFLLFTWKYGWGYMVQP